jgi:hypothetical protein
MMTKLRRGMSPMVRAAIGLAPCVLGCNSFERRLPDLFTDVPAAGAECSESSDCAGEGLRCVARSCIPRSGGSGPGSGGAACLGDFVACAGASSSDAQAAGGRVSEAPETRCVECSVASDGRGARAAEELPCCPLFPRDAGVRDTGMTRADGDDAGVRVGCTGDGECPSGERCDLGAARCAPEPPVLDQPEPPVLDQPEPQPPTPEAPHSEPPGPGSLDAGAGPRPPKPKPKPKP